MLKRGFVGFLFLSLTACAQTASVHSPSDAQLVKQQDIGTLPYHPLVYHLDLSILAYQVWAQSLVWPFDPHYEEASSLLGGRNALMNKIQSWAVLQAKIQSNDGTARGGFRGPGILAGFSNNPRHDPTIYRYGQVYPWVNTLTQTNGKWTEYKTPKLITQRINKTFVCYRKNGAPVGTIDIDTIAQRDKGHASAERDILLVFEGETGDKGEPNQPGSQSLMGIVLFRYTPDGEEYDVHIAFRGSRSGSAARAALQAMSDSNATGNPDWITDLGYDLVSANSGGGHITTIGSVSRGFAKSMVSILPQIFGCLDDIASKETARPPRRIYVTGHSLGGALAQHFVSAVLIGNRYGSAGTMAPTLQNWPWKQVKLITYGAPRAGDATWARRLTRNELDSEFFSTVIDPVDRSAFGVTEPSIIPRLMDENRPAAFRVLMSNDPITTEKIPGGKHVGKTVYVNTPNMVDLISPPNTEAHEPQKIRSMMLSVLDDARIPRVAWQYHDMKLLTPNHSIGEKGTLTEYRKLRNSIAQYYRDSNQWFDHEVFDRNAQVFENILQLE